MGKCYSIGFAKIFQFFVIFIIILRFSIRNYPQNRKLIYFYRFKISDRNTHTKKHIVVKSLRLATTIISSALIFVNREVKWKMRCLDGNCYFHFD